MKVTEWTVQVILLNPRQNDIYKWTPYVIHVYTFSCEHFMNTRRKLGQGARPHDEQALEHYV